MQPCAVHLDLLLANWWQKPWIVGADVVVGLPVVGLPVGAVVEMALHSFVDESHAQQWLYSAHSVGVLAS